MEPEEFARWVDDRPSTDLNHYELVNGRVVVTPPAGHPHGAIESELQFVIGVFVRAHALGRVFGSSQGFRLPSGDTLEPDLGFVSNARWRAIGTPVAGEFLKVVPDLVVEILSPSTRSRDPREKKAIYERNGVREYWLVDSVATEVTVFVLQDGRYGAGHVFVAGERVRSEILAGLEADVSTLVAGGEVGVRSEP